MKSKMPARITRMFEKAREPFLSGPESIAEWRESADVCALGDSERHLGHAIRIDDRWIAYDAIHFNPTNDGFRIIGIFDSAASAKRAIEDCVRVSWVWEVGGTLAREGKTDLRTLRQGPRSHRAKYTA